MISASFEHEQAGSSSAGVDAEVTAEMVG